MSIHVLSKKDISNTKQYYEHLVTDVPKPSIIEITVSTLAPGTVIFIGGKVLKAPLFPVSALATATSIFYQYAKELGVYSLSQRFKAHSELLDKMDKGRFINVKLQYPTRDLIASGVFFEHGIPKIIGFQQSSGNWIEQG